MPFVPRSALSAIRAAVPAFPIAFPPQGPSTFSTSQRPLHCNTQTSRMLAKNSYAYAKLGFSILRLLSSILFGCDCAALRPLRLSGLFTKRTQLIILQTTQSQHLMRFSNFRALPTNPFQKLARSSPIKPNQPDFPAKLPSQKAMPPPTPIVPIPHINPMRHAVAQRRRVTLHAPSALKVEC